ncbi:MAG: hypothetical protein RLN83_01320 [Balneola sp.]
MKRHYLKILLPLALGSLLLLFPLLRDLHFESAFLASILGCFIAAVVLAKSKDDNGAFRLAISIMSYIYIIAVPLLISSLIAGCLTFDGFAFWILLPAPSVFFGASIGRLCKTMNLPAPALFSFFILLVCSLGVWMIEFFTLPQVYFFNHVWGTWPGPIYDEALQVSESLLFFRWITILWIILLWILPNWSETSQNKIVTFLALGCLLFSYLNLDEMGIITPRETLKKELSAHYQTTHFDIYFEEINFTDQEMEYWALRHEFHFQQIIDILEIDWPEGRKIESYIYANSWQKKKLVGAKFTSYVPIWLDQDQLHIAKQHLDGVLKHEMVHVISKQFGNSLFNGSWSIGMIEGIAEAIAKDASSESTLDQIISAESSYPSPQQMKNALSNSGFYSSASSISYTTAGSFVQFLLNNYPVENFKKAYPTNDFKNSYPVSFDELVYGWHQHLKTVEIDSVDKQISEFIFSRRSLFQKHCPHVLTKEQLLWDEYNFHVSSQDSTKALKTIGNLYELSPDNKLIKRDWIREQLLHRNYATALYAFDASDTLLSLQILNADALFLNGDISSAQKLLQQLKPQIDSSDARNFKYSYELRSDSLNWSAFLTARYKNKIPLANDLDILNTSVKMMTTAKAIELGIVNYYLPIATSFISKESLNADWFDIYEEMILWLVLNESIGDADLMINSIDQLHLRARYSELLTELKEWRDFVYSEITNN